MSHAPVVLIGLDACDHNLVRKFVEAGELPNIARLFQEGANAPVDNPYGLLVGAVWANFATGLTPSRHGFYCWEGIEVETYRRKLITPDLSAHDTFWKRIGDAGKRVCAIDVPHSKAKPVNGVEVVEWGCHDRHHGLHSFPTERARALHKTFGAHPVMGLNPFKRRDFAPDDWSHRKARYRTPAEEKAFADDLRAGIDAKRRMNGAMMAEEPWDLFISVYGDTHAVGHQLWHVHDAAHPRHDPAALQVAGGDPVLRIYRDLDAAVGEHRAKAGPNATFLLLLSHGMGAHYDGTHMLDEILARLDLAYRAPAETVRSNSQPAPAPVQPPFTKLKKAISSRLPEPAAKVAWALNEACILGPLRARKMFFMEPNNTVYGGVRLNIAGREPNGCVEPSQVDALCAQLEADLLALRHVDSGRPLIRAVVRADRDHQRSGSDALPDLFIDWDRDQLPEKIWSERTGVVEAAYDDWRTGDHRPEGLLLASGPGLSPGRKPALKVEDIGPSIAALLGVTLDGIDGRSARWLTREFA